MRPLVAHCHAGLGRLCRRRVGDRRPRSTSRGQRRCTGRLAREQAFDQRLSGQPEVLSYVAQDAGKGPNAEAPVARNRDVVLAVFEGGQPKMATGLAGHPVAQVGEGPSRDRHRRLPAEASSGDDFLADEMEADDLWNLTFVEMATNRVADFVVQARDAVGLREDRLPESSGRETPFRGLLNQEDQFRQAARCHRLTRIAPFLGWPPHSAMTQRDVTACTAALWCALPHHMTA